MAERYFSKTYANGLTLLAEQMPGMQSAAMTLLMDAGAATDPVDRSGTATVLSELVLRGAGSRDSRQLTDYLDTLGLQRGASVGVHHARFSCAGLGAKVLESLATYSDIVRRPHLPEDGFEPARDLALQSIAGIDDEPRQRLSIELRKRHLPAPFGRNPMGEKADLENLSLDACRSDHANRYQPSDAILAIAGNIDFDEVDREVQKYFGDWKPNPQPDVRKVAPPFGHQFEVAQSEQTHIGIAYPSLLELDDDYYVMRMAIEVLSGGMSGRLFTEVREKRGLCYSVSAHYSSLKSVGAIFGYAGTSNDRAQATLDCFVGELHRLSDGVTADELSRAKIGLKSSTIMSGESTSARAGSIAHDFFIRGRLRGVDEILNAIDAVTVDRVNAYLKAHPPGPFTTVIVGPKDLILPK